MNHAVEAPSQCSAGQSIIKSSENKALPGKGMGQLFKNQMSIEEGGSNGSADNLWTPKASNWLIGGLDHGPAIGYSPSFCMELQTKGLNHFEYR
jgi:hypothetical protein